MYKSFLKLLLLYIFNYFKIFNIIVNFNDNIFIIMKGVEFNKINYNICLLIREAATIFKKFIFESFEGKARKKTNDKKKFRTFLNKNFKFVDNNKFNIYNLGAQTNRTVDIITSTIKYKSNFKIKY